MSIQYIYSLYPHILSSFMHVFTILIRVLIHFSFIFAYILRQMSILKQKGAELEQKRIQDMSFAASCHDIGSPRHDVAEI